MWGNRPPGPVIECGHRGEGVAGHGGGVTDVWIIDLGKTLDECSDLLALFLSGWLLGHGFEQRHLPKGPTLLLAIYRCSEENGQEQKSLEDHGSPTKHRLSPTRFGDGSKMTSRRPTTESLRAVRDAVGWSGEKVPGAPLLLPRGLPITAILALDLGKYKSQTSWFDPPYRKGPNSKCRGQ